MVTILYRLIMAYISPNLTYVACIKGEEDKFRVVQMLMATNMIGFAAGDWDLRMKKACAYEFKIDPERIAAIEELEIWNNIDRPIMHPFKPDKELK